MLASFHKKLYLPLQNKKTAALAGLISGSPQTIDPEAIKQALQIDASIGEQGEYVVLDPKNFNCHAIYYTTIAKDYQGDRSSFHKTLRISAYPFFSGVS